MAAWYRENTITYFSLKKTFYLDSIKTDVVKMIFHVLFLVLENIERRN